MEEGTREPELRTRELLQAHRRAITHVDRVYSVGMTILIALHVWRWFHGESSTIGVLLLCATALFSAVMTKIATRARNPQRLEPWRFPILYFISPIVFYYTDPATAFLATYLFMGAGVSAFLAMAGGEAKWSWVNLLLWSLNLGFAFSLLPSPNWSLCLVMVTILCVMGATFHGLTSSLHRAIQEAMRQTEELTRSQAELARSAKFAALGEMAGGVAHEINTPLTVIHFKASQLMRLADQGSLDITALRSIAWSGPRSR